LPQTLPAYRDARADEIVTHGSTPEQHGGVAAAWAAR
jgi:hypothetical protein